MNITSVLFQTPWWVYAIFALLVVRGVQSLQAHTAPLMRLLIVPLIFVAWSLYSIRLRHGLSINSLSVWLLFAIMGALFGMVFLYQRITVDKKNMQVHIPGSVYPLIFYMFFFAIKYGIAFIQTTAPQTYHDLSLWIIDLSASGFISGIFIGRFIHIWRKYNAQ